MQAASDMLGTAAKKLKKIEKHGRTYSSGVQGMTLMSMFGLGQGMNEKQIHY